MRDLHLIAGLFVSPFIIVFAVSAIALVHPGLVVGRGKATAERGAADLPLPANLERLSGRARIDAVRPVLDRIGVHGEVGWIQHRVRDSQLIVPVTVPGRTTTVTFDLAKREALIREQPVGLINGLIELHKSPGPHLVDVRQNWPYARLWGWLADATVYLVLLVTVSGLYLWYLIRSERTIGVSVLCAGVASFIGLIYALVH